VAVERTPSEVEAEVVEAAEVERMSSGVEAEVVAASWAVEAAVAVLP
jgi:hypothetical protein